MRTDFLIHHPDDTVGVVVIEGVEAGAELVGGVMGSDREIRITALQAIPLGHKIALIDICDDAGIIKYGHDIGRTVAPIAQGEHVHVHNVKTRRW